ncbi:hypothetical protein P2G88_00825 [Aliiglaciecola sp. CAU 1673]|uniref:hypothetical protein n=1 Tax=Aliiglaciecola sp. CAU 1673 TaxID=3032595 RepID=UPI0023DAFB75|nr:hypothetical protein [Aliiglaciecola sp. CAU 1673]MDF2176792.1 hypothetical protein [Aliiglaciecola sp. CAU 1673]
MTKQRRLSGTLLVFFSVAAILGIGGLLYYFNIEKNEEYQNQLHFRELTTFTRSLDNGAQGVKALFKNFQASYRPKADLVRAIEDSLQRLDKEFASDEVEGRKTLSGLINESDSVLYKLDDLHWQFNELWQEGSDQIPEFEELNTKIKQWQQKIADLAEGTDQQPGLDVLGAELSEADDAYYDLIFEVESIVEAAGEELYYREEQDCSTIRDFCSWLDNLEFDTLDLDFYEVKPKDASWLTARLSRLIEEGKAFQEGFKDQHNKLLSTQKQLEQLKEGQINQDAQWHCQMRSLWQDHINACLRFEKITQEPNTPAADNTFLDEQIATEQQRIAKLISLSSVKQDLLSNLLLKLQDEMFAGQLIEAFNKVNSLIRKTSALYEQEDAAYNAIEELEDKKRDLLESTNFSGEFADRVKAKQKEIASAKERLANIEEEYYRKFESLKLNEEDIYPGSGKGKKRTESGRKVLSAYNDYIYCISDFSPDYYDWYQFTPNFCDVPREELDRVLKKHLTVKRFSAYQFPRLKTQRTPAIEVEKNGECPVGIAQGRYCNPYYDLPMIAPYHPLLENQEAVIAGSFVNPSAREVEIIQIPLSSVVKDFRFQLFPMTLLVDEQGHRLMRSEEVKHAAFQSGLRFEKVDLLLQKLASKQQEDKKRETGDKAKKDSLKDTKGEGRPGYSGYVDMDIAGESYRVFIMPWQGLVNSKSAQTYYLLGFKPIAELTSRKLSISSTSITLLVSALLAFFGILPLLKIRLISKHQGITPSDRKWVVAGLAMLTAVGTIVLCQHLLYDQLKSRLTAQAQAVVGQIQANFSQELTALVSQITQQGDVFAMQDCVGEKCPDKLLRRQSTEQGYFLESLFLLPEDGQLRYSGDSPTTVLWSSNKLFRERDIDLSARNYYTKALHKDTWSNDEVEVCLTVDMALPDKPKCFKEFVVERILNKTDGRKNSQFAMPLFDQSTQQDKHILSFGTQLQTFLSPLLPNQFGFLVFDNDSGQVLFHSDDSRSLTENIYVETDNSLKLKSLVENIPQIKPVSFVTNYRGADHLFQVASLMNGVPWTLAVYYQKDQLRNLLMLLAFTTFILTFLLIGLALLLYGILQGFGKSHLLRQFLWFNPLLVRFRAYPLFSVFLLGTAIVELTLFAWLTEHTPGALWWQLLILVLFVPALLWMVAWRWQRRKLAGESSHQPAEKRISPLILRQYCHFLICLLLFVVSIPSLLIYVHVGDFYLSRYSQLEASHLHEDYQASMSARKSYFAMVLDSPTPSTQGASRGPCYLGLEPASETMATGTYGCEIEAGQSQNDGILKPYWFAESAVGAKPLSDNNLAAMIWRVVDIQQPIAALIWLHSQSQVKTEYENLTLYKGTSLLGNLALPVSASVTGLLSESLRSHWLVVAFILLTVFLLYWWMIHNWLCMRLLGINIPHNFRVGDNLPPADSKPEIPVVNQDQTGPGKYQMLMAYLTAKPTQTAFANNLHMQIIRPSPVTLSVLDPKRYEALAKNKRLTEQMEQVEIITGSAVSLSELSAVSESNAEALVAHHLDLHRENEGGLLVLKGFEGLPFEREQRRKALEIMEYLLSLPKLRIVLLVDISPLYRLTQQDAYPFESSAKQKADAEEVVRWCRVMKRFTKFYDWTPGERTALPKFVSASELLLHESGSWPECEKIAMEFLDYHRATRDPELAMGEGMTLRDLHSVWLESIDRHWSPEQVMEFFAANAGAHYRYRWELCTKEERLMLLQVAVGMTPNPMNIEPLEHLVRRGYLFQDNGWHMVNRSFSRFVLTAEGEQRVADWFGEAAESSWKYIRIPIFLLLFVLLGILAYSATEAFESVMALLTASLGLIPLLLRNINLLRGGGNAES